MLGEVRLERSDDAQFVGKCADAGKKVADRQAGLAVLLEFPRAGKDLANVVELGGIDLQAKGLAVLGLEARFRIETVHLRNTAIHEEQDDVLRARGKVRGRTRFPREQRPERKVTET